MKNYNKEGLTCVTTIEHNLTDRQTDRGTICLNSIQITPTDLGSRIDYDYSAPELLSRYIKKDLFQYNSVLVLMASVGLFCFAVQSKHSWKKISGNLIKKTAAVSFGVYLLHEHGSFRNILWHKIVRLEDVTNEPLLFAAKMLLTIILVYAAGCLLNTIIQKLLALIPFNKQVHEGG